MNNFNCTIGDFPDAPRGWVCPRCGRVYSPSTSMCFYCGGNSREITIDTTQPPHLGPMTTTDKTIINVPSTNADPEWWKPYITGAKDLKSILQSDDTFRVHPESEPYYTTSTITIPYKNDNNIIEAFINSMIGD